MDKRHFYTNIDINSTVTGFLNRTSMAGTPTEQTLYPFVDAFAGSQITDILFCTFCQYSNTESDVWTDFADKFEQKLENGIPVDYYGRYCGNYAWQRRFGIDPYAVWFQRCREKGIHPWISIRMNDCHCPDDETAFLRGDFFYEAKANGWMVGEKYGYYRNCFNYAVAQVRKKMLAYIGEQLSRYDIDGLELDFMREVICFDYMAFPDCAPVMTGFVREVRALVNKTAKRLGHPVRLGVRLPRDIAQSLTYGMDAAAWTREQLVDLIVVTPRWASCDSDMPVAEWKSAFPETEIAAGLEILVCRTAGEAYASPAATRGYALKYLSEGADSVYLFNRFFTLPPADPSAPESGDAEINRTCGTIETAAALPLRNIMTFQDIAPEGADRWQPLPLTLSPEPQTLSITLGSIPAGREEAVLIGFSAGTPADSVICINNIPYSDWTSCASGKAEPGSAFVPWEPDTQLFRTVIPASDTVVLTLRAAGKAPVTVTYLEVEIP